MNNFDIIANYLRKNKFDGLVSGGGECGCELSDLWPCENMQSDCRPGYKIKCDPDNCSADGDCDWHIGIKKTKSKAKQREIKNE